MAGQLPDWFQKLAAPFDSAEVKVRTQAGRQLQYVTARTVMNRLDEVLGPANWWDHYVPQGNAILCSLTIRLPDGSTITKEDAGGFAGMPSEEDNEKSGYSDAFKRAAVKFGVARYLYRDGVPHEAEPETPTRWDPSHAVDRDLERQEPPAPRKDGTQQSDPNDVPQTGRQLFKVLKNAEDRTGAKIVSQVNAAAKSMGFSGRMIDWSPSVVEKVWPVAKDIMVAPSILIS